MAKAKKYQDFIFPEGVTTLNADKFVALGELKLKKMPSL